MLPPLYAIGFIEAEGDAASFEFASFNMSVVSALVEVTLSIVT